MKLKTILFTAFLSFAITPVAMAMTGREHYLRGLELRGIANRDAVLGHFEDSCNKNYAKGCEEAFDLSKNPIYSDKACKLGSKEYCGKRKEVEKANKQAKIDEMFCEELNQMFCFVGSVHEDDDETLSPEHRELKKEIRIYLENEEKFGREKAEQMRKEMKAKKLADRKAKAKAELIKQERIREIKRERNVSEKEAVLQFEEEQKYGKEQAKQMREEQKRKEREEQERKEREQREQWEAERPKREKRRAEKAKRLKELYNAANKDQSFCDKHPKKCSTKTYSQTLRDRSKFCVKLKITC